MKDIRIRIMYCCFIVFISVSANLAVAEELEAYAKKCDAAMGGVTVPDFNCDNGTAVPTNHFTPGAIYPDGDCDEPNRLNKACDPGSRFTVLKNSLGVIVVAHCRKKGYGQGQYGDIAVIQHNKTTGATCFYQSHVSDWRDATPLNGNVKAPSRGTGAWPWNRPAQNVNSCVSCHDNGPIIRSPYLAQLKTGLNALPGATDRNFNSKNQPYGFVGEDFSNWKVFRVEVDDNLCIGCHRLGVSNLSGKVSGTALDFALRATGQDKFAAKKIEEHKNPYSKESPIWMPPPNVDNAHCSSDLNDPLNPCVFQQTNANAAKLIHDCALHITDNPLPNSPSCRIVEGISKNSPM